MMEYRRPRVLVQLNRLAAYRVPVFNLLADHVDLDVASFADLGQIEKVRFNTIRGKLLKIGPFLYNRFPVSLADYDVIITGFDGRSLNSYYYAVAHPGKTILFTQGYGSSLFAAIMRRAFHNRTVATLVYTQSNAQQLIKTGVDGRKVFFTGNTEDVAVAPERERRTFLHMGRPQARKGINDTLHALSMIRAEIPDHIRLVLVGPGVEAAYRSAVQQHGLNDLVEFHGEIRDELEIAELFAEAIAFVSGHIGLSAPQSLGHSVPIIARADIAQGPEYECMIDGYTGRTYRSCEELAETLFELATQPTIARKMGEAGQLLYDSSLSAQRMCNRILAAISFAMIK